MSIQKDRIQKCFHKAYATYDGYAVAQQQIQQKLAALLCRTGKMRFRRILEIGSGTGGFTQQLALYCKAEEWVLNDLCDNGIANYAFLSGQTMHFMSGDAETLEFPGEFDLVASASAFQWFEHPGEFISRICSQLHARGVLLFNTFGKKNMQEVGNLTGIGLKYPSVEEVGSWIPSGFEVRELSEEEITLRFGDPLEVLRHLKYTGVTAAGSGRNWTRNRLQRFSEDYIRMYSDGASVTLTFHPVYVLAVKK